MTSYPCCFKRYAATELSTPNPCIACNKHIKFDDFYKKARQIGCDYVATGHYAKIEKDESTGRYLLKKSVTDKKDQTYALYNLTQEQLEHTLLLYHIEQVLYLFKI